MHPILDRRRNLLIYLGAWIPIASLLAWLLMRTGGVPWGAALALSGPLSLLHAFICLSSWYVCSTLPVQRTPVARLLLTHLIAAAVSAWLWLSLARGALWAVSVFVPIAALRDAFVRETALLFTIGALLFLLAIAISYLFIALEASREAEKSALELRVLTREAELKALRAQIDPHFLFNSLHSISALTTVDPMGARRMAVQLADFLRDSLAVGARDRVTLADELSLAEHYLAVEQVRFGPRLMVETRVDPEAAICLVPPLILQPLIENAVTHGISDLIDGGSIMIEARRRGDQLAITVENPRDPGATLRRGLGVGLNNVKTRLQTMFGREGRLEVVTASEHFRVELTMPADAADHVAGIGVRR